MRAERKTILVAVDFDGASKRALEAARWVAGGTDADLVVLHVHDRPGFSHPQVTGDMVARIEELAEQNAKQSLADIGAQCGAKQTLLRHGDPAARILETATELGPAMVVMGTHGRRGLGRLLVGSVAANVVRACPVPVVTVRARIEDVA